MANLNYRIVIEALSEADGGGYLATVPDLPGCQSDGETRAEALAHAEDAIESWLSWATETGRPIPEPELRQFA